MVANYAQNRKQKFMKREDHMSYGSYGGETLYLCTNVLYMATFFKLAPK